MTKRNISKLFAVAVLAAGTPALASPDRPASQQQAAIKPRVLASGRPACGNTMAKLADDTACDRSTIEMAPMVARRAVEQQPIRLAAEARRMLRLFGLTDLTKGTQVERPREYRNGKPANGNIPKRAASKSMPKQDREIDQ